MTKSELREIYLVRQKSLSTLDRKQKSEQITEQFVVKFDVRKIHFLHCFLPIERFNEIDTKLIFEKIWRDFPHIETLAPRVDFQTHEIENLKFTPDTNLIQNAWQIHEPVHNELIETEKIDAVLIPLLCFDERGFRIGYGKGFYDRFLKNCRVDCLKIGLSYFAPVKKIEDAQDFDVKLDFCIAPEKVWRFSNKIQPREKKEFSVAKLRE
ncbi:5-formyltetrahydrofolate cyclo-ligase [soil metagenome]|jgi:5-formyltetrahydrofolate cyclo-ligase|nr:5-formyltetrahydrofolate cyclo-ligase [Acidobacteriota bacterium]